MLWLQVPVPGISSDVAGRARKDEVEPALAVLVDEEEPLRFFLAQCFWDGAEASLGACEYVAAKNSKQQRVTR